MTDAPSASPQAAVFAPDAPVDVDVLLGELHDALDDLRQRVEIDPFMNPIQLLALRVKRQLDRGEFALSSLELLIQRLTLDSFLRRSERLRRYLGQTSRQANLAGLRRMIEGLTRDPATGATVPFEAFRHQVERARTGAVFTAHPTFSLAKRLQEILVELATGTDARCHPIDEARRAALIGEARRLEHRPDDPLDLSEEHRQSLVAIGNLLAVLRAMYDLVLEVAQEVYPGRWTELDPRLLTVANWVGYDLDGRSDIPWATTFEKRLRVQTVQLERYRTEVMRLRALAPASSGEGDLLELLEARLTLAIKQAEEEIAVFAAETDAEPRTWRRQLARAARTMHQGSGARLTDTAPLIDLLERALGRTDEAELRRGLCVLRAEIRTHGLGLAHTHTRLNARQLHNAVRKAIGMDHPPDDPSHRLSYLNAIGALIEGVRPVRINFGSLLTEKATAKRVFMIIAQMLKYLDGTQPVRFLIAECETGFTLLSALYFAKLFGVEDKVEISPLFETRIALEQGAGVLAEALGVASFRAYVRAQGRLCIQTGFSDAGRYLGQIAAAHAIESLRLAVARELAAQGLADVELIIFDTHGESIGRGGHPGSLGERLDYIDTAASRAAFARAGITVKQEISFQGGDGLSPIRDRGCGARGGEPDARACARPDGGGRRPVLPRDRLRPRVLHRRCTLQPGDHGRSLLRRAARAPTAQTCSIAAARALSSASTTCGPARPASNTRASCARSPTTRSCSSSASSPTRWAASARRWRRTPSASSVSTSIRRASAA